MTRRSTTLDRRTYSCEHDTKLPGKLVLSDHQTNLAIASKEASEAHIGARVVHTFFKEVLGMDSLDNKGLTLISSVHYDKDYNNAFFNGEQMVYGDGDGKYFLPLTKDEKVIAHEDGHCLIQNTCGLAYVFQSGAANESYADKIGIAVGHWLAKESDPYKANWFLGEKIVGPEFPGKALRSFSTEPAYEGEDNPRYMKDFKWMLPIAQFDMGGVHINSSILNHAFYLYCHALNEPSYGRPIQIAVRALSKLKKYSGFKAVKKAEIEAARELYGDEIARIVEHCYKQVGI